jgi:hypothetical protein
MKDLLVNTARVLADMQKVLRVRFKAGYTDTLRKHFVFALFPVMVRVFAHPEMMHFVIFANRNRIVFHSVITIRRAHCLRINNKTKTLPQACFDLFSKSFRFVAMQQVYYKRIKTYYDYPDHQEVFEDYITYGLSRQNWVEICRTMPLADMKERQRLVAEALNVEPDQIVLIKK